MGGGIGEGLGKPPADDAKYELRILFDVLFFMIVIIILLSIAFGTIIDAFAQLRDQKNDLLKRINNVCHICSLHRS